MYIRKSSKLGKPIKTINAGEYYYSGEEEFIGTLLGSCVAVCLHDPVHKLSGMNHFMLPGKITSVNIFQDMSARYGITAITELLNSLEKNGAERENLIAKVFGGGSILEYRHNKITIPYDNVRLAKIMLELEDIPIAEMDVGDSYTRKLLMDVQTGRVFLKKTQNGDILEKIHSKEVEYAERSFKKQ